MELLNNETIPLPWQLPVPTTSFVAGPTLKAGHTSTVSWTYEGDSEFARTKKDGIYRQELNFEGVVAYKCTYSLFCSLEMAKLAYDKVVDLGETEWLSTLRIRASSLHGKANSLKHLAIFFDEGPCYEFVCEAVRVSESRV
jgi:hypothetical protein